MNGTDQNIADNNQAPTDEKQTAELQRRREQKWLEMIRSWDMYMLKNYKKVRERCRKGIPTSIRAQAWLHLCGGQHQMVNPSNKFEFRRLHVRKIIYTIAERYFHAHFRIKRGTKSGSRTLRKICTEIFQLTKCLAVPTRGSAKPSFIGF